jgi:RsmE family RNA methyltransferase
MKLRVAAVILYILFLMLPIYWLVIMSFKTTNEILGGFSAWPQVWTTASYRTIFVNSACEQCGRNRVPAVATPVALVEAVQAASPGLNLVLTPAAEAESLGTLFARHGKPGKLPPVTLLIGPEGGLDAPEVSAARLAGFVGCRLGPRVLRTETAALAALAALQSVAGDFA